MVPMQTEKKIVAADVVANGKTMGEILGLWMEVSSNVIRIVGKP